MLMHTSVAIFAACLAMLSGAVFADESTESSESTETIQADSPIKQDDSDVSSSTDDDESLSGYDKTVPTDGGTKSVSAELIENDTRKQAILQSELFPNWLDNYRARRKHVSESLGLSYNVDYSFLTQGATYSTTENDAASSVFRIYGNWFAVGDKDGTSGNLIMKFEHRAAIWGDQTPRDMGFNTGSALSTANYKENGWGFTDFYWKQLFSGGKSGFLFGHMDPGDWADQHVLLNAWTNLLNDSFYNNPAEAIPKRTFSLVGRLKLANRWYAGAGVHDANGKDNELDFTQVFSVPELFTWAEIGFASRKNAAFGETTHLHYWHQDERVAAGVDESWGVTFSSSVGFDNDVKAVLRVGYSEGPAAQMREFVGGAVSMPARGSDRFMVGASWGSPPDKSLPSQTTFEALYRLYLTQGIVLSPDVQVTLNPSFNVEKDVVVVYGLRARFTF